MSHSLFSRLFLALLVLCVAFSPVDARPTRKSGIWTNAQRLAQGLNPLRPRLLYGSRTDAARRSVPSETPGSTYTAGLILNDAEGNVVGFVGAYGLTRDPTTSTNADHAWLYTYTVPNPPDAVIALNHPGTPYRLSLVAIRSGAQVTMGPGNPYYLEIQNTRASTSAGSKTATYVYDTYAIGYAQTTVWSIDPKTGVITPKWVNPDGTTPTLYVAVSGTNIYVTGDLTALANQLGTVPTPVTLTVDV